MEYGRISDLISRIYFGREVGISSMEKDYLFERQLIEQKNIQDLSQEINLSVEDIDRIDKILLDVGENIKSLEKDLQRLEYKRGQVCL